MPEPAWEEPREEAVAGASPGLQMDLIRSYLRFAWRAIRPRWVWVAIVLGVGLVLTGAVLRYAPRTYNCTTVLMAVANPVLDPYNAPNPLAGASSLIMRQENIEAIVRETGLVQKAELRRPPILSLKDRAMQSLFGQWSAETKAAILVGTLQSKLSVGSDSGGNLSISVDWSDGKTAAEIAEAARESFLRGRHAAEISAFEAKMSILDEHSTKLRVEVENLAQQINAAHEARAAQVTKATGASAPTQAAAPAMRAMPRRAPSADLNLSAELPEQKTKLAEMKRQLAEVESDRERRLREQQGKLAELKLRLTPSHPQVVMEEERIGLLSQVPSDVALLRSEVADLESNIKGREALIAHGSTAVAGSAIGAVTAPASPGPGPGPGPGALPPEIIQALENDNTDPALTAQISGAVVRYGTLRDEIRAGRMGLDTAQAAFDHRYQIVVPADVPDVPMKPKRGVIAAAGLIGSLLLALLLPIIAELRRGIIIERWQVQQMNLPVLAELRLPPSASD